MINNVGETLFCLRTSVLTVVYGDQLSTLTAAESSYTSERFDNL